MTSSDAVRLDDGSIGLITYWELGAEADLDVYRCIDVVDSRFRPLSQECSKVLRPTGARSARPGDVLSSRDICAEPDNFGGGSDAGYCSFSAPMAVRTPLFELTIEPFGELASVAVEEEGRSLFVIEPPWPSAVVFNVSAMRKADHVLLAGASSTMDILELHDGAFACEPREVSSHTWVACRSESAPDAAILYRVQRDVLYEIWYGYPEELANRVQATIDRMIGSFRTVIDAGTIP